MTHCSSPLSAASAISRRASKRARWGDNERTTAVSEGSSPLVGSRVFGKVDSSRRHTHSTGSETPSPILPECLSHGGFRRGAGRNATQISLKIDEHERRQRAAIERSSQCGAADVGDLGVAEAELPELRQHSSRRRQRTCRRRRRRRHEGGEALVAELVDPQIELLQRGQPPQGRREGHQPRVMDGGAVQIEFLEPRHGASAQGGGKCRGACVAHVHAADGKRGHSRQRARAQPLSQPLHAVGAGSCLVEVQLLERWQHRAQRAQRRQVGRGETRFVQVDPLRLAQLLAAQ
eukprot:scaffold10246_cov63-Phaeocystis_antarctica.AAC.2